MIDYPPSNGMTQGTIFTCATAEDYGGTSICGLVITARCDVAHGKAPIISYVPLVPYREWLLRDGLRVVASRAISSAEGAMKSTIREASLADSIFHTLSADAISAQLNESSDKAARAIAKRFDEATKLRETSRTALRLQIPGASTRTYLESQQKLYNQVTQELLSNSIADFHYLERSEPREESDGHVALLREIRFIPAPLASRLLNGIDITEFAAACKENPNFTDKLAIINSDDYAMPIGLLRSPFIEFLMQRLTQLFARIGVTDYPPERFKSLKAVVPFK